MLMLQFYLILGCVTRLEPKELLMKSLPLMPLNVMIYFFPPNMHMLFCFILMFVCSFVLLPKFSTIILLIVNVLIVCILQISLLWLKFGLESIAPVTMSLPDMAVYNIDQMILLTMLYYFNRKRGDKYVSKLVFRRRKK
jgi:hypothetical protein